MTDLLVNPTIDTQQVSGSNSRPDTPLASHFTHNTQERNNSGVPQPIAGPSTLPPTNGASQNHTPLPVPNQSADPSQPHFTYRQSSTDSVLAEPLAPEIASADISIAPDGSFVETSSGPAAIELKRRYDQHYGVSKSVRSIYAITAFVNQHGKQMYRVGHRDQSAPAAQAAEVEQQILSTKKESPRTHRSRRATRMSVTAISYISRNSISRPHTSSIGPNKIRKPRKTKSIPDLSQSQNRESYGRTHSNSVTSGDTSSYTVDDSLSPGRSEGSRRFARDIFAEVMDWSSPGATSTPSFSNHSLFSYGDRTSSSSDIDRFLPVIDYPFGKSVVFDSPNRKAGIEYLRTPRLLREMQSFESGLTARQSVTDSKQDNDIFSDTLSLSPANEKELARPASAIRLRDSGITSPTQPSTPSPTTTDRNETLMPETATHSRYSTDVFDVLQTYRGLPRLDKISDDTEETAVIRMSLSDDSTPAPRNDPRFVIWGTVNQDADGFSGSQESLSESLSSSNMSRRRSQRNGKGKDVNPKVTITSQRVLVAATIERWIAQLTSDFNYDELLNFFLTYRTYISSVDLCHLLICRFHWAIMKADPPSDERDRRIVRVRTFVALRYWLLTFFTVDFLPNRELRLLVASWLNTIVKDPFLVKQNDGLSIVKKLRKVVRDCKKTHIPVPSLQDPPLPKPVPNGKDEQLFGQTFAEATRKLEHDEDEDEDIDLDFLPTSADSSYQSANSSANSHLNAIQLGNALSPPGANSISISSRSILHRTDHAPGPDTDIFSSPFIQSSDTLPIHHGALSRVFTKTMGRIGRWKRVLNNRSSLRVPLDSSADVSAFDLELSVSRDLLTVNGGIEQYLKLLDSQPPNANVPARLTPLPQMELDIAAATFHPSPPRLQSDLPTLPLLHSDLNAGEVEDQGDNGNDTTTEKTLSVSTFSLPSMETSTSDPPKKSQHISSPSIAASLLSSQSSHAGTTIIPPVHIQDSDEVSLARTSSTDSFGRPLSTAQPFRSPWKFDPVDDLDFSDSSEEGPSVPPGLRKYKRLPRRAEFEFAPRPESVSSMGIGSRASVVSGRSSTASDTSGIELGGSNIQQWQMNALLDSLSDDDAIGGDAEDALKRLEGQIDSKVKREKTSKVNGWVKHIYERMVNGDYDDEEPRFPYDDDDEEEREKDSNAEIADAEDIQSIAPSESKSVEDPSPTIFVPDEDGDRDDESFTTGLSSYNSSSGFISPPSNDAVSTDEVVPIEILQSRMPSEPLQTLVSVEAVTSVPRPTLTQRYTSSDVPPKAYQSFIMIFRAEVLAQHFAMIDRELFMGIKFEELVLDDWSSCEEVNVLDWAQYLKDRARWKAESRHPEKTSALAAVRARFNLMANFIVAEVILAPPNFRPRVVAKMLRIAWKAYCLQSFNTLVAIITGLQNTWVNVAMRKSWSRLPVWEARIFNDLKAWTTNADSFKHIRHAVDSIVDQKPLENSSYTASVISSGTSDAQSGKAKGADHRAQQSACVPFVGTYLSQLRHHNRLPDLIDPTAPNEVVGVDPVTSNFDSPAHPEVFSALEPLPPGMHLEPLINVQKQRLIAAVIKSLVAGQHLASRVQLPVDKKLFQKCLRLRALDSDTLQRALNIYAD